MTDALLHHPSIIGAEREPGLSTEIFLRAAYDEPGQLEDV
jgi:hypothetical protein